MPPIARSSPPSWTIVPQGDRSLIVVFGDQIDITIGKRCADAAAALRAAGIGGISDIVPTFNSVALHYRPRLSTASTSFEQVAVEIEKILYELDAAESPARAPKLVEIPVCYGGEHGPDLAHVAEHCKLDQAEVIRLHSEEPAYVFMLGFAPGAPYIGVHDKRLAIGRRATPRTSLPAGSVAIANLQTMIYPNASPGGWHILGATPAVLFDPAVAHATLLSPGDSVKFVPIGAAEFLDLKQNPR